MTKHNESTMRERFDLQWAKDDEPRLRNFALNFFQKELLALADNMKTRRENNICTCERRICHCGKFASANETSAYNRGLEDAAALIRNRADELN